MARLMSKSKENGITNIFVQRCKEIGIHNVDNSRMLTKILAPILNVSEMYY